MRWQRLLIALVLPLAPASCSETNKQNYARAAVATGAMIAAVGINRAITDDCWGRCSAGYLCNEESGLCELGECLPGCEVGYHCVKDVRGVTYCASDDHYPSGRRTPRSSTPLVDAGTATPNAPEDASVDATAHTSDASADADAAGASDAGVAPTRDASSGAGR